jgi:hypothetical protein
VILGLVLWNPTTLLELTEAVTLSKDQPQTLSWEGTERYQYQYLLLGFLAWAKKSGIEGIVQVFESSRESKDFPVLVYTSLGLEPD